MVYPKDYLPPSFLSPSAAGAPDLPALLVAELGLLPGHNLTGRCLSLDASAQVTLGFLSSADLFPCRRPMISQWRACPKWRPKRARERMRA